MFYAKRKHTVNSSCSFQPYPNKLAFTIAVIYAKYEFTVNSSRIFSVTQFGALDVEDIHCDVCLGNSPLLRMTELLCSSEDRSFFLGHNESFIPQTFHARFPSKIESFRLISFVGSGGMGILKTFF